MTEKLIEKVISGGQTGADLAGLRAAKDRGIETGGTAPKGYKTEYGPMPDLLKGYGLEENDTADYLDRTIINIRNSHGTVIFKEKHSKGSNATIRICQQLHKPYVINPRVDDLRVFVGAHGIRVLNIAGNRETVSPGIEDRVYGLLKRTFTQTPIEE